LKEDEEIQKNSANFFEQISELLENYVCKTIELGLTISSINDVIELTEQQMEQSRL